MVASAQTDTSGDLTPEIHRKAALRKEAFEWQENPIAKKIVECAVKLADQGGFPAVRLREVAQDAGIGLGTLYTHFRSKEDILVAAVSEEVQKLRFVLKQFPPPSQNRVEQAQYFFKLATNALFTRDNFARAVMRSIAAGDHHCITKILVFREEVYELLLGCWHGFEQDNPHEPTEKDAVYLLEQIWFAKLIAWVAGIATEEEVLEELNRHVGIVLRGFELGSNS